MWTCQLKHNTAILWRSLRAAFYFACWGILYFDAYIENKIYAHKISFDSDIFEEHIKVFMRKHIEHWGNKQPFNGLDVAVGFYNGVLENFTKYELKKCSPDDNVYDNKYFWYLSYWWGEDPKIGNKKSRLLVAFATCQAG